MENSGQWIKCAKCGKKLLKRLPNALFEFKFGRRDDDDGRPPVDIVIQGNLKIRCLRRGCGHETIINFFPLIENTEKNIKALKDFSINDQLKSVNQPSESDSGFYNINVT